MEIGSLHATLSINDQGYTSRLDQAGAAWEKAAARIGATDPAEKIKQNLGRLTNTLDIQQRSLLILEDELGKVAEKYGEASLQARKKEVAMDRLRGSIVATGQRIGELHGKLDNLGGGFEGLSEIITGGLRRIGEGAVEGVMAALDTLIDKTVEMGARGVGLNDTLQQVDGQLMALTKSAPQTADLIAQLREEANRVPSLPFQELAQGMVALIPAAKQAKEPVLELLQEAEKLAALNPSEGIQGGIVAVKELLAGDWTSAIERFNLSRSAINQLKEEGVPNLEILRRTLADMGVDMDLVGAQANTLSGRWAAWQNLLTNTSATATREMTDELTEGLGRLLERVQANGPAIDKWATGLGESLGKITASAIGLAEKIPWAGIANGIADTAEGAALLADALHKSYVAAAGLYIIQEAAKAGAAAFIRGEDAGAAFDATMLRLGQTFGLIATEAAPAAAAAVEDVTSEAKRGSVVAYTEALAALGAEEARNTELMGHRTKLLEQQAKSFEDLASKQASLNNKLTEEERKYTKAVSDAHADLAKARLETQDKIYEKHAAVVTKLGTLERDHQKALADIQAEGARAAEEAQAGRVAAVQKRLAAVQAAEEAHAQALAELERQHSEAQEKNRLDLSRKEEDIERERVQRQEAIARTLAEIDRQRTEKVLGNQAAVIEAETALALDLVSIENKKIKDIEKLQDAHEKRARKLREGLSEIEGKLSGNAMAQVANGRASLESFLSKEDKKRYQELQKQLAEEQAEHEKAVKAREEQAATETSLAEQANQKKLDALAATLEKEKEALDRQAEEATRRYTLDEENRKIANERALADLQGRIAAEDAEFARQQAALDARREEALGKAKAAHEAELTAIRDKHQSAQAALDEHLKAANDKYAEQGAALRAQYQEETADLVRSLQEREAATRAKLAEMQEAHRQSQYDLRYQLYETSLAHQQRMEEIARQWDGPLSKVQEYEDAIRNLAGAAAGATTPIATSAALAGGRAAGGNIDANKTYLVGEQGRELVTSRQNAAVLNNRATMALLGNGANGGGGVTIVVQGSLADFSGLTVTNEADEQRFIDRALGEMDRKLKDLLRGGRTRQEVGGTRHTIGERLRG